MNSLSVDLDFLRVELALNSVDVAGLIFGHFEKNSNSEKLKTQAKFRKNSGLISKKLRICKLHLSTVAELVTKVGKICLQNS